MNRDDAACCCCRFRLDNLSVGSPTESYKEDDDDGNDDDVVVVAVDGVVVDDVAPVPTERIDIVGWTEVGYTSICVAGTDDAGLPSPAAVARPDERAADRRIIVVLLRLDRSLRRCQPDLISWNCQKFGIYLE